MRALGVSGILVPWVSGGSMVAFSKTPAVRTARLTLHFLEYLSIVVLKIAVRTECCFTQPLIAYIQRDH